MKSKAHALGAGYAIEVNDEPQFASITLNGKEIVRAKLDPLAAFYCWKHQEAADLRAELERVKGERDQLRRYVGASDTRSDYPNVDAIRAALEAVKAERDALAAAVADAEVFAAAIDTEESYYYEPEQQAALDRFRNRKVNQ